MLQVDFQAGLGFGVESVDVFGVADACGGLTLASHELALRRLEQAGARLCSWIQVLLEFQRDWTRHATYALARAIVVCERRRLWNGTRVRARDNSSGLKAEGGYPEVCQNLPRGRARLRVMASIANPSCGTGGSLALAGLRSGVIDRRRLSMLA